jgi:hypothetical protein
MVLREPDPDGAYLFVTIVIGNNREYRIDQPPASERLVGEKRQRGRPPRACLRVCRRRGARARDTTFGGK